MTAFAASAGEKTVGLRGGYNTRAEAPVAGLFFQYRFSEHFGVSPNVDYYFRHEGTDALSVNINAHAPFRLSGAGKFAVYPLGGVNYTSWNYHDDNAAHNDASSRVSRLGLNLGGGLEFKASPTLKLSFEAKSTLIKEYSSGTFTLSIGYVF